MSEFIGFVIGILILLVIPILFISLIVRAIMKKPCKKTLLSLCICFGAIIPLTIIGVLTDPATWCEHEYSLISEVAPTCSEKGKIVYVCGKCEREKTDKIDKLEHDMQPIENGFKCSVCGYEEITKQETPEPKENEASNQIVAKEISENSKTDEIHSNLEKSFRDKGFTSEEISSYKEILTNVGITDYHDIDVIENGRMHIVRGKIYDSKNLQLNITLEDRKIILVELAGIPTDKTEAYINWRGKLKFKKVGTKKSIDLYYDMDGGYVAKIDWENKIITPYNE